MKEQKEWEERVKNEGVDELGIEPRTFRIFRLLRRIRRRYAKRTLYQLSHTPYQILMQRAPLRVPIKGTQYRNTAT